MNNYDLTLINLLSKLAAKGKLPHAILFSSDRSNCLDLAINLAQLLLCETNQGIQSSKEIQSRYKCDCASCGLFLAHNHPDFYAINLGETIEIKIDHIREATEFVMSTPYVAKRKILLINPVDNLNLAAANAFLKTLEELEQIEVIFLLITTNYRLLPPTILSRVVRFHLKANLIELNQPNVPEDLILGIILQDLHDYWVTSKITLNDLVSAWLKIPKKQLLDCLWLILTRIIKDENNKLIYDLNQKIPPYITWILFDSLNYINKLIILKVPINWQLFLYNFLLTNITRENIYGGSRFY